MKPELQNFEMTFEIKTNCKSSPIFVRNGHQLPTAKNLDAWNKYRIMVDGHRVETWINNRLVEMC